MTSVPSLAKSLTTATLQQPDAVAFASFGTFILPPERIGERTFYSEYLNDRPSGSSPVLHINHLAPSVLPLLVTLLERHPFASQCFIPLNVSRYVVVVMPSDADGLPMPEQALAYEMPPTTGVIFHPGVWHLGATVLDRTGHFAVLMWRGGKDRDDDFRTIAPLQLHPQPLTHLERNRA